MPIMQTEPVTTLISLSQKDTDVEDTDVDLHYNHKFVNAVLVMCSAVYCTAQIFKEQNFCG